MSVNITTFYVQEYAKVLNQLVQQEGSRLRGAVTEQVYEGKAGSPVEQVGAITMQPVSSRYAPMGRVDAPTDRRWVYPSDFDLPQLFDNFDKLRLLIDPKSKFVKNAVDAAGRQIDDLIISAMFGTAKTGETGGNSITIPSSQVVSVQQGAAAPTGLTVAKLREAKRILLANEAITMDSPEIYCVAGAKQLDNLLAEAQVVSTDFNDTPVLVDGVVKRFLGINFIHSERLPQGTDDQSGTSTKVCLWHKSGMHLGLWGDIKTNISQRHDLQSEPWQAYVTLTAGATRLEEKRVVQLWAR
jgi:Phage capsid protein